MPVLRQRAATWCLGNDLPEDALQYSMAAGDAGAAAELVERLALPAWWQGRATTVRRWYQWLEDRGAIGERPVAAVHASIVSAVTGRPADAEPLLREAAAILQRGREDQTLLAEAESTLGETETLLHRYDAAEPLLLRSYTTLEARRGAAHRATRSALARLVALYVAWHRPEKAAAYQARLRRV